MGRFVDDRYEAEFTVNQSQEEVWQKLMAENEHQHCFLGVWPSFPGFEVTARVTEVDPPNTIRAHKESEPCKDSEIAVSLEATESGTKVLVVQSGFPAWVKSALESFTIGGDQIICDLVLYLETGVEMSRHSMPWAFAGFTTHEVGSGLQVAELVPGCFGEKAGIQPGDLLMTLGGAPVFTQRDLQALLRVLPSGDTIEASWVRGGELLHGQAVL